MYDRYASLSQYALICWYHILSPYVWHLTLAVYQ